MPKLVYADLPWPRIRERWQSSEVGLTALAAEFGISSTTTLKRRRTAEGWTRDARRPIDRMASMTAEQATDPGNGEVVPKVPAAIAGRAEREISLGREAQRTAQNVLQRLQAVMAPPSGDPAADESRTLRNLRQLIRINPEKETLAGLMAAATKVLQIGVAIEGRALETASASKGVISPDTPPAPDSRQVQEFLSKIDETTIEKMKSWALEVQQVRRQAEIDAARK